MPTNNRPLVRQLFEMRFKPNSKILDFRGAWTDYLSREMNLPDWKIDANRLDLFDSNHLAFLSFKNCGFATHAPETKTYFEDQTGRFLRAVFAIEDFKPLPVGRLGVRSIFLTPYNGDFKNLFEKYQEKVVNPNQDTISKLEGTLIDIGAPLNFKANDGFFNTMSGPTESNQAKELFPGFDLYPAVGLFFEIDYFKNDIGDTEVSTLVNIIKSFSQKSWNKMETLTKSVFG